jgi:hypothetical protein
MKKKGFTVLNNFQNRLKSKRFYLAGLIILVLILAVLVLIGVGYKKENSEKPEEEKNEEEKFEDYSDYKNEQWDFEIKYPNDWGKQEETLDAGFAVSFLAPQETSDDSAWENVTVLALMPEQQNFDELMAQTIEEIPKDSNANLMDYSKVIVSGYPGYKLSYSYVDYYSGKLQSLHYFINAGDKWYQILYVALESTYSQYLPQAQTMINSFVIK